MKYSVYSVQDKKVGFGMPYVDQNDATAVRGFSMAINNGNGTLNYSPEDYDLYCIGEFDSEKGIINGLSIPKLIVSGHSVFGA